LRAASAEIAEWTARLGAATRPRIGLAWSGNPKNKRDAERSIAFDRLRPLLDARCEFHCLQTEFRAGEAELARAAGVHLWGADLRDFADTAALVASLDLVVTVDTSLAHLAGALGKSVWILLPQMPDYRWLLDRDDTPWYASARLFRQPTRGDWEPVISKVRDALAPSRARRADALGRDRSRLSTFPLALRGAARGAGHSRSFLHRRVPARVRGNPGVVASHPLEIQQTMSGYLLAFAVMFLFHGALSDSFGGVP
jgi:hypothetical protein